ncbi:lantibiotic ABC transporter [Deinococcus piscis]|uniref:Lantibiotic ABC transporter n=1 Tax=Deinococcus piscis TaxID=394230 RepID=A0ABQ3K7J8_9DEIO|nr:BtrH N-terminal domain-containing protein [Deinococcus piscis]GHG07276.1 lantibiotic ABC transporter [Deinococcus piscis]
MKVNPVRVNASPFIGQHCETTATGTLLGQLGTHLSEPMLFGLGQGLGFVFWNMKTMPFPFIGGRIKPDLLTANIAHHLGMELRVQETSSRTKAWEGVKSLLDAGKAVGLKLDCFHLDYFTDPIHFAGHYVAILGYNEQSAFLVDTVQQGSQVVTSLQSLERARNERGPMSSRNLWYTLEKCAPEGHTAQALERAVRAAIRSNAAEYLQPPIKNLGYQGIEKASREIVKWFDRTDDRTEFAAAATLMERAGTGGALFRNLYRDFLLEAAELTGAEPIGAAHAEFVAIAQNWSEISALFEQVAQTGERQDILQAAERLRELSVVEKSAMQHLAAV